MEKLYTEIRGDTSGELSIGKDGFYGLDIVFASRGVRGFGAYGPGPATVAEWYIMRSGKSEWERIVGDDGAPLVAGTANPNMHVMQLKAGDKLRCDVKSGFGAVEAIARPMGEGFRPAGTPAEKPEKSFVFTPDGKPLEI